MFEAIFEEIKEKSSQWQNEEELRAGWVRILSNHLSLNIDLERGKTDAKSNNVIIEFKKPSGFLGNKESPLFKKAVYNQLDKYIKKASFEEGVAEEDYIGIAIDGDNICFAFRKGGKIKPRNFLPFSEDSVMMVAQALLGASRRAVTSENLSRDFGHESVVGRTLIEALSSSLETHLCGEHNNKIKMLFEEWRTLFGQVADLSEVQEFELRKTIPVRLAGAGDDEIPALLFVIHTYNALVIKMLAAEIVSEYELSSHGDFCESLLSQDNASLIERLTTQIEKSGAFEAAAITGFVEEAIFSWYIDVVNESPRIVEAIRSLLAQVALYRMDALDEARSKDVLKSFYQALVPGVLRKALGEFYTPDWLAALTCQRSTEKDWLLVRGLDPTCGSGTFLLNLVKLKRNRASEAGWGAEAILDHLTTNVWGFDLNPLAVQTARVNFLISIADLLKDAPGHVVNMPVLLADAVYSPAHYPESHDNVVYYEIGSDRANLKISLPSDLAFNREMLDDVLERMADSVENDKEFDCVWGSIVDAASDSDVSSWKKPLKETYDQVLELHRQNWNGIWFKIVRNFFWSATAGQFDVVVGNPPWVRWSNLPEAYRQRIKPTCEQYEIFSDSPYHGGNELDISGMITYTVGDKWLREGGTLTFLITQTHFQTPSSQGFRSFKINNATYLSPILIEDLKELKPFPNVANKTALMKLEKGATKPSYPVRYRVWKKAQGYTASIPADASLQEVLERVDVSEFEASPVEGLRGPWAILRKGRLHQMRAIQGASEWIQGRKGITTDLNGLYMVSVVGQNNQGLVQIQTRPEACKGPNRRKIEPAQKFWVEPDCLYPLVKGAADFSACHFSPKDSDLYVLVPNKGIRKKDYAAAEAAMSGLRKLKRYFQDFAPALRQRSTYKLRQLASNAPSYAIYNTGRYTFAPYKVMWPEQGKFEVAVAESATVPQRSGMFPYVPDHKVYFAEMEDKYQAHYLCGLLNCSLVREYVESHTIGIQRSNVFKHLKLPRYDKGNSDHIRLWALSLAAHQAKTVTHREELLEKMNKVSMRILVRELPARHNAARPGCRGNYKVSFIGEA
ncbi:Eco57I restriction-modification methylase domain-containing protein [Thalassospira alkalitolerans]|uniref:Eco57I restriction-modification methylase domain-containing protein n=1 Tax=Thalassospira alkalitolerans TaxID=1293890 RepID=UPI003AA890B8